MSGNNTIELNLNIKDKTQPVTVAVPPTLTPQEIISDLQESNELPRPANRTLSMTHGKLTLTPTVPIGQQGVNDKDTVAIVWEGNLAWRRP